MARNLVICLDGTGAQLRAKGNTNVLLLYKLLDHSKPTEQIAYYDPGVGTFASAGAWTPVARALSRLGGLAFGTGMRQNLGEAYTWLAENWRPDDRIFVFGFSRGAYTARALLGMLQTVGLLRPGTENLVPYVTSTYARRGGEKRIDWDEVHLTAEVFAQTLDGRSTLPVAYLGVWDTVKAAGLLKWTVTWPYTRAAEPAHRVRHAVSIDERRAPFKEYLVDPRTDGSLEEVWFAGVHSDVGGTFDDPRPANAPAAARGKARPDPKLSKIALKWIVDGAVAEGLLVRPKAFASACAVSAADAEATLHKRGWAWFLLGTRHRRIPPGAAVHSSVLVRAASKGYPKPENVTWVDPDWQSSRP
ncbi:DUF2235 domain-containing protein [Microbacterium sp. BWT-B31]|uniref:DUF2235 domain-containing protein n=1 Tax=Microbacterium sp. BWT-B31 TaxID=3232072 RepID=UPI0035285D0A